MARFESQSSAGFFPTPEKVMELLCRYIIVDPEENVFEKGNPRSYGSKTITIFDPCAGTGSAVKALRDCLDASTGHKIYTRCIELEPNRVEQIKEILEASSDITKHFEDNLVIKGNSLKTVVKGDSYLNMGLMYLNPPYDYDRLYGRTEEAFLQHWTNQIKGQFTLLFVIPYTSIKQSIETLSKYYSVIDCVSFPYDDFKVFNQVIIIAHKLHKSRIIPDQETVERLEQWSRGENLKVLGYDSIDPIQVGVTAKYSSWFQSFEVLKTDYNKIIKQSIPFYSHDKNKGNVPIKGIYPNNDINDFMKYTYDLAMYPKPAHVATAVASGVFNGIMVNPNNKRSSLPPLLVKGVFKKAFQEVKEQTNKKGEIIGMIEEQKPQMIVTVYDLESKKVKQLENISYYNENLLSVNNMSVADLLYHYSDDLLSVMLKQCNVMYNPEIDCDNIILPRTKRRPYEAQAHAIRALSKLYGRTVKQSRNKSAILLGEIGCGKTTVALVLSRYLKSKKTLVLCPPHLLTSWQEQVNLVLGNYPVMILNDIESIDKFRNTEKCIGVMSREAAKLHHEFGSIKKYCPKCGYTIPDQDSAKHRAKCTNTTKTFSKVPIIEELKSFARCLSIIYPSNELVRSLTNLHVFDRRKTTTEEYFFNSLRGNKTLQNLCLRLLENVEYWVPQPYDRDYYFSCIAWLGFYVFEDVNKLCTLFNNTYNTFLKNNNSRHAYIGYFSSFVQHITALCILNGIELEQSVNETLKAYHNKYMCINLEECSLVGYLKKDNKILCKPKMMPGLMTMRSVLFGVFEYLYTLSNTTTSNICNEPLYYSTPKPRRYSLATYIAKYKKDCFDFLIIDEGHEYSSEGSAQEKAAHRLVQLGKPTLLMTGSIMNGYADSLFSNLWALSPKFREEFDRDDMTLFIEKYGYKKQLVQFKDTITKQPVTYGVISDRVTQSRKTVGIAPGVLPLLIMKHLLPIAVTLHKEDLAIDLPDVVEQVIKVEPTIEQKSNYDYLLNTLKNRISDDLFTPLMGKLFGQLAELPSYLDRCTLGNTRTGDYEIRYPESCGGQLVASSSILRGIMPKEKLLIDTLIKELSNGRKCLVFCWHVQLLTHLQRIIEDYCAPCVILDSKKVKPSDRQDWIEKNVLNEGYEVMILNPVGVKTGINNLVSFSSIIWYEDPACNPEIYRQANGRIDRIGQKQSVNIFKLVYSNTLQEIVNKLTMSKVAVSLQTDGLDSESALIAAGVGDDDRIIFDNIGKMLFDIIKKE